MTLDDLAAYGANVQEGLGRCMNMEAFYLQLVETIKAEPNFDALAAAIDAGDLDAAFSASHALKVDGDGNDVYVVELDGVLSNLSLTPLQKPMEELCELLRAHTDMDYAPLMAEITQQLERFRAL